MGPGTSCSRDSRAEPGGEGLYGETDAQDDKESLLLLLSPCRRSREPQEGERNAVALLRSPSFNANASTRCQNLVGSIR